MAIARKPKPAQPTPLRSEPEIEALIARGGGMAQAPREIDAAPAPIRTAKVILRLPPGMIERVDAAVARRALPTPRHTWLLEAVLEKLEREMPE